MPFGDCRPMAGNRFECLFTALSMTHQPTTNHRSRSSNASPTMHVGRAVLCKQAINAIKYSVHQLAGVWYSHIGDRKSVITGDRAGWINHPVKQMLVRIKGVYDMRQVDKVTNA